jgi:hypothetical protein
MKIPTTEDILKEQEEQAKANQRDAVVLKGRALSLDHDKPE